MKRMISVVILIAAAIGITSTAWAVEPAGKLSKKEVNSLILSAKSPADHTKLANYYRFEASQKEVEVKEHEEMAASYDKNPVMRPSKGAKMGDQCRSMVKNLRDAAKEATEMAAMHDAMAKAAK